MQAEEDALLVRCCRQVEQRGLRRAGVDSIVVGKRGVCCCKGRFKAVRISFNERQAERQ